MAARSARAARPSLPLFCLSSNRELAAVCHPLPRSKTPVEASVCYSLYEVQRDFYGDEGRRTLATPAPVLSHDVTRDALGREQWPAVKQTWCIRACLVHCVHADTRF